MQTDIKIHICQICREDIASGTDAKNFPLPCKACQGVLRKKLAPKKRGQR